MQKRIRQLEIEKQEDEKEIQKLQLIQTKKDDDEDMDQMNV
jgi:hypothetical protein